MPELLAPGTRVKLRPSAGLYASHGRITTGWRSDSGIAEYVVEMVDATGRREIELLTRDKFTVAR